MSNDLIPGLKKSIQIAENRLATANACLYNDSYKKACEDVIVFLRAELERQEKPEKAKANATYLD